MDYMGKIKGAYNAVKEELGVMGMIALETAIFLGIVMVAGKYCGHATQQNLNPPAQYQTVTPSQLEKITAPEQNIIK